MNASHETCESLPLNVGGSVCSLVVFLETLGRAEYGEGHSFSLAYGATEGSANTNAFPDETVHQTDNI